METEPTAGPTAAVTIAGVDVDGLHVTVAGFVSGVVEAGGTCKFVLTSSVTNAVIDVATTGEPNVSTTSCGSAQVPIAQFTKGRWKVVLDYDSTSLQVTSAPLSLEVP